MFYGLDVHKEFIQVCELARDGKSRRDFRIGGSAEAIEAFARKLEQTDPVVLEATFHTWAIVQILSRHVDRVVVADPAQLKAIAQARIKTDKVDAHILAQLLRLDFLPEVEMPDRGTWALRQLLAHRRQLRRLSVATKNTIHSVLNRSLKRYPGKFLFSEKGFLWLEELELPAAERMVLDHQASLLRQIQERLTAVDGELLREARLYPEAKLLVTIPGVDVVVAMGFRAAIGSIDRFRSPQKLTAYFGLVPKIRQPGSTCYYGHITKAGSRNARWLAIEAAHSIARSHSPLVAAYHRIRPHRCSRIAAAPPGRILNEPPGDLWLPSRVEPLRGISFQPLPTSSWAGMPYWAGVGESGQNRPNPVRAGRESRLRSLPPVGLFDHPRPDHRTPRRARLGLPAARRLVGLSLARDLK